MGIGDREGQQKSRTDLLRERASGSSSERFKICDEVEDYVGSEIPRVSRAVVVIGGDRKEEQEHAECTREVLGIADFGLATTAV